MAEKLLRYYKYMQDKEGFSGKVKLAQLTHIPSVQAAVEPDTPEVIERFKEAIKKITGNPPLICSLGKTKHDSRLKKRRDNHEGSPYEAPLRFRVLSHQ